MSKYSWSIRIDCLFTVNLIAKVGYFISLLNSYGSVFKKRLMKVATRVKQPPTMKSPENPIFSWKSFTTMRFKQLPIPKTVNITL